MWDGWLDIAVLLLIPLVGQPASESFQVHRAWEILELYCGSTLVGSATHVVANVLTCNTLGGDPVTKSFRVCSGCHGSHFVQ